MFINKRGNEILNYSGKCKKNVFGRTPFLWAAFYGHVGIMSVMYKSKPDVLLQTNKTGETAMHLAAYHGHLAAVDQLLEWDPKLIDARSNSGKTPFVGAAEKGHVDVMTAMIDKGGHKQDLLTQKDKDGWTALHYAASGGCSAAVSQLLEWGGGALLDIKDNDGDTPWDKAKNQPEIREIMKKYKPMCRSRCMIM